MFFNIFTMKLQLRSVLSLRDPGRGAIGPQDQPELFICRFYSAVFDIAASQTATTNEPITWRARPTYFHREHAHAVCQIQALTNHAGIANFEPMRILS